MLTSLSLLTLIPCYLGNKCDLEQERQVLFEEACMFTKETGILAALETSAKVMGLHIKHR